MARTRRQTKLKAAEVGTGSQAVAKHPELWFEDGNVILSVGNTLFRVYRGILARASSVFNDLFTLPQPAGENEVDGCPVVSLMDSAEDMANFLKVLYLGVPIILTEPSDAQYWPVTRAMVRIGHKYEAREVYELGRRRLMARLPRDIAAWNKIYDTKRWCENQEGVIEMANLGRLIGDQDVRLPALYLCAQLDTETLLGGCRGADGVQDYLCPDDLSACVDARPRLSSAEEKVREVDPRNMYCSVCYEALEEDSPHAPPRGHDPLADDGWIWEVCPSVYGCEDDKEVCRDRMQQFFVGYRQTVRDRLHLYII